MIEIGKTYTIRGISKTVLNIQGDKVTLSYNDSNSEDEITTIQKFEHWINQDANPKNIDKVTYWK